MAEVDILRKKEAKYEDFKKYYQNLSLGHFCTDGLNGRGAMIVEDFIGENSKRLFSFNSNGKLVSFFVEHNNAKQLELINTKLKNDYGFEEFAQNN